MSGRTIVITGASDGVGAAAARQLKASGEQVVIVGRSPGKTSTLARELGVPYHVADYTDLSQVRTLASELASYPRIDVLANNAGAIMGPREVTRDGFERTFQVNHLAGFLLTHLLLPKLQASGASIIQTASVAARVMSRFDIDDLQNARGYSPQRAYGNGKLENIMFTRELQRRHGASGIHAVAFHPGVVATNFGHDSTPVMRFAYHTPVIKRLFTITPEQGADQLVWLSQARPGSDWQPGAYYEKRRVGRTASAADDADLCRRLWNASTTMLGL